MLSIETVGKAGLGTAAQEQVWHQLMSDEQLLLTCIIYFSCFYFSFFLLFSFLLHLLVYFHYQSVPISTYEVSYPVLVGRGVGGVNKSCGA